MRDEFSHGDEAKFVWVLDASHESTGGRYVGCYLLILIIVAQPDPGASGCLSATVTKKRQYIVRMLIAVCCLKINTIDLTLFTSCYVLTLVPIPAQTTCNASYD